MVVVPALRQTEAIRRRDVPSRPLVPLVAFGQALSSIVGHLVLWRQCGSNIHIAEARVAIALWSDILRLPLIVLTMLRPRRENRRVPPVGRVPIGVVVPLLWTLQASAVAIPVLPRRCRTDVIVEVLVCHIEAFVTLPFPASIVRLECLMATPDRIPRLIPVGPLSVSGVTACRPAAAAVGGVLAVTEAWQAAVIIVAVAIVAHVRLAHVLDHHLASRVGAWGATTVLKRKLDCELGAVVIVHHPFLRPFLRGIVVARSTPCLAIWHAIVADLVPTRCVVLRIEQTVLILCIVVYLCKLVVRSPWAVHVDVTANEGQSAQQYRAGEPETNRVCCHCTEETIALFHYHPSLPLSRPLDSLARIRLA
mmetsp:Transcript_55256/g.139624  ORF Transcript_55256/g.139624 Transcript_55256/m.139624 type:complete len:365 (+) Transcript_55256:157-1251(+)